MKKFEKPTVEFINFDLADIISTSTTMESTLETEEYETPIETQMP